MSKMKLTVVTRLGSEGFSDIYDLQLCLAGQTDKNFIWLILLRPSAHKLESTLRSNLKMTPDLWSQTKIMKCSSDNRSKLLNKALKLTPNGYLVVFDDDDLPLSNFVESIRDSAINSNFKSIVRTEVGQIKTARLQFGFGSYQVSKSKVNFLWPSTFNRFDHLELNRTPCMAISFPVLSLKKNSLAWDEELQAVEDWDILMRASGVIPVVSIESVTSIYRCVDGRYRSQSQVNPIQWGNSEIIVRKKLEALDFIASGSQINSLRNTRARNPREAKSYRATVYTVLAHKVRERFLPTPKAYFYLKKAHKIMIKILRID